MLRDLLITLLEECGLVKFFIAAKLVCNKYVLTDYQYGNFITGINRKVRYAMKESDGHFTIDPVSGIVSLTRSLDREIQSIYNLTIYAHDQVSVL